MTESARKARENLAESNRILTTVLESLERQVRESRARLEAARAAPSDLEAVAVILEGLRRGLAARRER